MTLRSPLYEIQKNLGAYFTVFAGYEMPIQYSSILDEHMAVRKSVGLFDVSHMSNTWITGKDSKSLLSLTTVADASKVLKNQSGWNHNR
jgi:aminomethyltransferase